MAQFSLRVVDADFYLAKPIESFDEQFSCFRNGNVESVPVIRVYGATPAGQKTCLHVHQVYPYFFVPIQEAEANIDFAKSFARSLDFAIHASLCKAASRMTYYVHKIELTRKIPYYGYADGEKDYLLVYYYNPYLTSRIAELLLSGNVMNRIFQPHETHIPYLLQFFIDYNIYGMNLIYLSTVMFRKNEMIGRIIDRINAQSRSYSDTHSFTKNNTSIGSPNSTLLPSTCLVKWDLDTIEQKQLAPDYVIAQSTCELEVDCTCKHILNKLSIQASIGSNPGLDAIWEDEKERRRKRNESSQITVQESQGREESTVFEKERNFLEDIRTAIEKRMNDGETVSPSQSSQSTPSTPDILKDDLQSLFRHDACSSPESSQTLPELSQLADLLVALGEDSDDPSSEDENSQVFDGGLRCKQLEETIAETPDGDEDQESFVMSQRVFDDVDIPDEAAKEHEEIIEDHEFQESWSASLIHQIPQLDGSTDEDVPSLKKQMSRRHNRSCMSCFSRDTPKRFPPIEYDAFCHNLRRCSFGNVKQSPVRESPCCNTKVGCRQSNVFVYRRSYLPDPFSSGRHLKSRPRISKIPQTDGPIDEDDFVRKDTRRSRRSGLTRVSKRMSLVFKETPKSQMSSGKDLSVSNAAIEDSRKATNSLEHTSETDQFYISDAKTTDDRHTGFSDTSSSSSRSSRHHLRRRRRNTSFSCIHRKTEIAGPVTAKSNILSNTQGLALNPKASEKNVTSDSLLSMGYLSPKRTEVYFYPPLKLTSPSEKNSITSDYFNFPETCHDRMSPQPSTSRFTGFLTGLSVLNTFSVSCQDSIQQVVENRSRDLSPHCKENDDIPITDSKDNSYDSQEMNATGVVSTSSNVVIKTCFLKDAKKKLVPQQIVISQIPRKIYCPSQKPPSRTHITSSSFDCLLGEVNHVDAFYSKPCDAAGRPLKVGGNILKVDSKLVCDLPDFASSSRSCGLLKKCLKSFTNELPIEEDITAPESETGSAVRWKKLMLVRRQCYGDTVRILTPAKDPPKLEKVTSWLEGQTVTQDKSNRSMDVEPVTLKNDISATKQNDTQLFKCDHEKDASDSTKETVTLRSRLKRKRPGSLSFHSKRSGKGISSPLSPIDDQTADGPPRLTSPPLFFSPENKGFPSIIRSDLDVSLPTASTPVSHISKEETVSIEDSTLSPVLSIPSSDSKEQPCVMQFKQPLLSKRSSKGRVDLRRQLIQSGHGSRNRRSLSNTSQIEGPSPVNTYGFKVSQLNFHDVKALHEIQHLTKMSVELHIKTRRNLQPDPGVDPISACFYCVLIDTNETEMEVGILVVDSESFELTQGSRLNESTSVISQSDKATVDFNGSLVSTNNTSHMSHEGRPLLQRSGLVSNYVVEYFRDETSLLYGLSKIIRQRDPDILMGYEVEMLSWGYLIQRAAALNVNFCPLISRIPGSDHGSVAKDDQDGDAVLFGHVLDIKIAGRILLNVWRVMRFEVTLNIYTFENVAYHVLHQRYPQYTFQTLSEWWSHKSSVFRWRVVDYYVRRTKGNLQLLERSHFVDRTSELARLFGILFYSVISRGSQFRVESMMLRIAKPMGYVAISPSVQQRAKMAAPECIPLVMEPESRFYVDPVLVLDFQSLYPSIIIAYNYCFSTCLGKVRYFDKPDEFPFGVTSYSLSASNMKRLYEDLHVAPTGVAFVKSNIRRGILPRMLSDILKTRIMVKNAMKKCKDDKALHRMLDARQLGLKLIANVTYGYTSAHFSGRMPCVEIGDSIVRKARETLENAIEMVNSKKEWHARVVYGDTDSMFVLLKGASKERAFAVGKEIAEAVTRANPKPVKLKFEKVYYPCVLLTKKRYVGYMYETADQKEPVFDAKGIETVRRDTCVAVAKILERSLRVLFERKDISLIKQFVQRQFVKIMEGRVSIQDFTFAKEYRGMKNYKPGACVPALELTRRRLLIDKRAEPRTGERVPYVIVYGTPGLPLIQLVRQPVELFRDPTLRLNGAYYISKQIIPPLQRVFSLMGIDVTTWYTELPRISRPARSNLFETDNKKGTISQYFTSMNCLICKELTRGALCQNCLGDKQAAVGILSCRLRNMERKLLQLSQICRECAGFQDKDLSCVSLDCPVVHKHFRVRMDLSLAPHIRNILSDIT